MKEATKRSIFRWIHIVFSIPILGYIYSPFEKLPDYASADSVCLPSCNGPFGIVDVERPCPSTTYFEEIGLLIVNVNIPTQVKTGLERGIGTATRQELCVVRFAKPGDAVRAYAPSFAARLFGGHVRTR